MTTPEHDDLKAVETMISRALANGLVHEVVEAYLRYRGNGDPVAEAARCALYDWDI